MLISNVIIPILSSNRAPEAAMVGELKVKLENSRQALRKMSQCLGTTVVSSSSTETDEEYSSHSNEVDQQDPEFGKSHVFTTNVSFNDHNIFIYFFHLFIRSIFRSEEIGITLVGLSKYLLIESKH